jgi:hemolysin III
MAFRIREPFNACSHLVGLLLSLAGAAFLLRSAADLAHRTAVGVYGGSLVLLYAASTVYHGVPLTGRTIRPLRILDHVAIYFLIAGTYTPIAVVTLKGALGWSLLAVVWCIALAGIPFKLLWIDAPDWLSTAIYLAMGWLAVLALEPLARAVPPSGLAWLAAGGLLYTVGAVIFVRERPNPLPGVFGHHEIWHLLVLAGSACHFVFIMRHVG